MVTALAIPVAAGAAPLQGPVAAAVAFDGPPAPVPPAVMTRDAAGRVTVRAVRIDTPLQIDGVLDEALYDTVQPIRDFVQLERARGRAGLRVHGSVGSSSIAIDLLHRRPLP